MQLKNGGSDFSRFRQNIFTIGCYSLLRENLGTYTRLNYDFKLLPFHNSFEFLIIDIIQF